MGLRAAGIRPERDLSFDGWRSKRKPCRRAKMMQNGVAGFILDGGEKSGAGRVLCPDGGEQKRGVCVEGGGMILR